MTAAQRTRYDAAHLLQLAASASPPMTLADLARDAAITEPNAILLARRTLVASLGHGNWREVRAEAEARLRSGR